MNGGCPQDPVERTPTWNRDLPSFIHTGLPLLAKAGPLFGQGKLKPERLVIPLKVI